MHRICGLYWIFLLDAGWCGKCMMAMGCVIRCAVMQHGAGMGCCGVLGIQDGMEWCETAQNSADGEDCLMFIVSKPRDCMKIRRQSTL